MAGHSKYANIKHRKGAQDKKRAKTFTKIARKLIVAARLGGPDPATNPSLRLEVDKARAANMSKDVIQRNIDKGAGVGATGETFHEITYEGYAAGGIAVLVDILTDNRNRTAPEVKKIFERSGGNMGEPGCVGFMFQPKSVFLFDAKGKTDDELMEIVVEAEAEDMEAAGEGRYVVTADRTRFVEVKDALEAAGFELELAEIRQIPDVTVQVTDEDQARKIRTLIEALDDHDDVQGVSTNHEISEDLLARLDAED